MSGEVTLTQTDPSSNERQSLSYDVGWRPSQGENGGVGKKNLLCIVGCRGIIQLGDLEPVLQQ